MKTSFFIAAIAFIYSFISCRKDAGNSNSNGAINGQWAIAVDSSYQGVGLNNHLVVYNGQAADYFDFAANGHLYVRENNLTDTFVYQTLPGNNVVILPSVKPLAIFPDTTRITRLSLHDATLSTGLALTPGGIFGRTVVLSR